MGYTNGLLKVLWISREEQFKFAYLRLGIRTHFLFKAEIVFNRAQWGGDKINIRSSHKKVCWNENYVFANSSDLCVKRKNSLRVKPFKCYTKSSLLRTKLNLLNDLLRRKAMITTVEFLQRNETYNTTQTLRKRSDHKSLERRVSWLASDNWTLIVIGIQIFGFLKVKLMRRRFLMSQTYKA
jgi:hypothetical protein